jgi:hypothetical protein
MNPERLSRALRLMKEQASLVYTQLKLESSGKDVDVEVECRLQYNAQELEKFQSECNAIFTYASTMETSIPDLDPEVVQACLDQ